MQPSKQELETAFKRTELALRGVTFDQALSMPAVKTGLTRIALNAQRPPKAKPVMFKPKSSTRLPKDPWWIKY